MANELEQRRAMYEALKETYIAVCDGTLKRMKANPPNHTTITTAKTRVDKTLVRVTEALDNLIDIMVKQDPPLKDEIKELELNRCDFEDNAETLTIQIEKILKGEKVEFDDEHPLNHGLEEGKSDGAGQTADEEQDESREGAGKVAEEQTKESSEESEEEEEPLSSVARACLDAHNKYRAKHGATDLTWDEDLHSVAQQYAEFLARSNQFHHSNNGYGENLAGGLGETKEEAIRYAVKMWYDEVSQYNYTYGGFSMSTGHFTQVVWKGTKSVGIGASYCNSRRYWIVCANYSPPGNYQGQFQQNVKAPR